VDSYGGLLTYIGGWLDRAGGRRADAKWLDELLNRPDATLIPFWRDQCLVSGDPPVPVTATAITEDFTVDGEELLEARWFTSPSYASMPRLTRSAAPTPSRATCSAPG
jgi:hypothetical protein